jgi:abortive infection alpha-like protein
MANASFWILVGRNPSAHRGFIMGKATDNGSESELLKAGVELVKAVPIYEDAIQPLAKELGKAGGTIGEAVNAAFLPLRGAIWGFKNIASFIENRVSQNLTTRNVPRERIQFPDPDVAVPAIEAMRYSKLRSQYAELLTTAIDSKTARDAHPAFVEVLKQLTPDEARILSFMPRKGLHEPLVNVFHQFSQRGSFTILRHISMIGIDSKCNHPDLTPRHLDNLCRLGLLTIPDQHALFDEWRYDRIRSLPEITDALEGVPEDAKAGLHLLRIGLTDLGDAFRTACVTESSLDFDATEAEFAAVTRET